MNSTMLSAALVFPDVAHEPLYSSLTEMECFHSMSKATDHSVSITDSRSDDVVALLSWIRGLQMLHQSSIIMA